MEKHTVKESSVRDYVRVIFRNKIIFLVLPFAILIPVIVSLEMKTPIYSASVTLHVQGRKLSEVDFYTRAYTGSLTEDHTELVKSITVLERVVNALKLYQVPLDYEKKFASRIRRTLIDKNTKKIKQRISEMNEEERQAHFLKMAINRLRRNSSALPVGGLAFFNISVKDYDQETAVKTANSLARSYVIFDIEQQINENKLKYGKKHSKLIKLEHYIEEFKETLDGRLLSDLDAMGPASVKIVKQAVPMGSSNMNKRFMIIFSLLVSIVFGVILAFIFEYFNQTFTKPSDIEEYIKIPFLGSIPKGKFNNQLIISDRNSKNERFIKSYQILSEQIFLLTKHKNLKTVLITDVEGSKDLYSIGANISSYLAYKRGCRVLNIDAGLRDSGISSIFKISNNVGLADILEDKASVMDVIQVLGNNLYVLPSGETDFNPITLLDSSIMSDVVKGVQDQFDIVIIVCPDLKNYMDAVVLSSLLDSTILVVNEGEVRIQAVINSIAHLKQKHINIIGAILNNRKYVIPEIIYKKI